ncbi:MAG: hypothetical protein JO148_09775 [Acidimicrobiia bacterium]|nr:hypothetical protein [Acidimicrobiia bacterium]
MANKVKVGFFSFTEILENSHRGYNEWHLFDHMPEQFKLEGLHWGQRWVATPELMKRRLFAADDLTRTQYVTLYLMTEPVQQALDDFYALGRELHKKDRWFDARKSHLSGPFDLVHTYVSPRLAFDADAVPYRPNRGIFVTAQDAIDGPALEEAQQWYDQVHIPELLNVRGVAGCWWFENADGRTIRVYWLDDDPNEFIDDLKSKTPVMQMMDLRGAYSTLLVGAYQSIPWNSAFDWFD